MSVFIVTRYAPRSGGEVNTGGIVTGGTARVALIWRDEVNLELKQRRGEDEEGEDKIEGEMILEPTDYVTSRGNSSPISTARRHVIVTVLALHRGLICQRYKGFRG
jgi:hypothetical protein